MMGLNSDKRENLTRSFSVKVITFVASEICVIKNLIVHFRIMSKVLNAKSRKCNINLYADETLNSIFGHDCPHESSPAVNHK